ncbi:MAG: DUF3048 domain-containing protein [Candidatus Woykebacteria bacterium]
MKGLKILVSKYKNSPKKKKFSILVILALFILASGFLGYFVAFNLHGLNKALSPSANIISGDPREPRNFPNPINGILYTASEASVWKDKLPLAVVIENHLDARPQSGFAKADLVYEALAEGGITRCLAIYLAEDSKLGPVRSNRPYFLDWVSEYSAGYAHVGGSPKAQSLIKPYRIKDLDQFGLGVPTYERSSARFAPHNVYTTTKKLRSAAASRGYKGGVDIGIWKFSDDEASPSARPKKFELKIPYPAFGMDVLWKYDRSTNTYLRFNASKAHKDAEGGKQLFAKTVIVQSVITSLEGSGSGRLKMKTIGSGKAQIFKDGMIVSGTWKKSDRKGRTKFFDSKGDEVALNRGKIWVEVVPTYIKVVVSKK